MSVKIKKTEIIYISWRFLLDNFYKNSARFFAVKNHFYIFNKRIKFDDIFASFVAQFGLVFHSHRTTFFDMLQAFVRVNVEFFQLNKKIKTIYV
jgi:hypothetical protein